MARLKSHEAQIAALVPVCVNLAQTDADRVPKLESIQKAISSKRDDAVMAAGWATIPGSSLPNRDLAQACLAGLDLNAP